MGSNEDMIEKFKTLFGNWLNGDPTDSKLSEIEAFIFMHDKIKSKLNQGLKILEDNNWTGLYIIVGDNGSGKTQFAIWLLNELKTMNIETLFLDLTRVNLSELKQGLLNLTKKEGKYALGVFIDNMDSILVERDYLEKAQTLFTTLFNIQRNLADSYQSVFFVILLNQSTWIRFSKITINSTELLNMFKTLSSINISLYELKKIKSEVIRKIIGLYYFYLDSEKAKNRLIKFHRIVLSFLQEFYLSQLTEDTKLKNIIIKLSNAVKVFVENLDESVITARKSTLNEKCQRIFDSYLLSNLGGTNYLTLNDPISIEIAINLKLKELMQGKKNLFLEINYVSSFGNSNIMIPIIVGTESARTIKTVIEALNKHDYILVFNLFTKKSPGDMNTSYFQDAKLDPRVIYITLTPWTRYICYLNYEGASIFLDKFTKITMNIHYATLYFVLRDLSDTILEKQIKENIELIIFLKIASTLTRTLMCSYEYNDFKEFLSSELINFLQKVIYSSHEEHAFRLLEVINSILEKSNVIEPVDEQYVFRTNRLNIDSLLKVSKAISRELAFRIKFFL